MAKKERWKPKLKIKTVKSKIKYYIAKKKALHMEVESEECTKQAEAWRACSKVTYRTNPTCYLIK